MLTADEQILIARYRCLNEAQKMIIQASIRAGNIKNLAGLIVGLGYSKLHHPFEVTPPVRRQEFKLIRG